MARHDLRDWQVTRREHTHQLIELGGLIAKAGLIDLTKTIDLILRILIEAAGRLRTKEREQLLLLRRRAQGVRR